MLLSCVLVCWHLVGTRRMIIYKSERKSQLSSCTSFATLQHHYFTSYFALILITTAARAAALLELTCGGECKYETECFIIVKVLFSQTITTQQSYSSYKIILNHKNDSSENDHPCLILPVILTLIMLVYTDMIIASGPQKGKKCVRTPKAQQGMRFELSGCSSTRLYKPKFCGVCTDSRCCTPHTTITAEVEFHCPEGDVFTKQMMFIKTCSCHHDCAQDNDIFLASNTRRMIGDYDNDMWWEGYACAFQTYNSGFHHSNNQSCSLILHLHAHSSV